MTKKLLLMTLFMLLTSRNVWSDMDPRVKALGTMALYGTAGGAILGTATLAFGSSGRSVAKGASIGLYAGIVFGTYIVASHMIKQHRMKNPNRDRDYYPDEDRTYEDDGSEGGGLFDASIKTSPKGQKWQPMSELAAYRFEENYKVQERRRGVDLIVPVFHMTF